MRTRERMRAAATLTILAVPCMLFAQTPWHDEDHLNQRFGIVPGADTSLFRNSLVQASATPPAHVGVPTLYGNGHPREAASLSAWDAWNQSQSAPPGWIRYVPRIVVASPPGAPIANAPTAPCPCAPTPPVYGPMVPFSAPQSPSVPVPNPSVPLAPPPAIPLTQPPSGGRALPSALIPKIASTFTPTIEPPAYAPAVYVPADPRFGPPPTTVLVAYSPEPAPTQAIYGYGPTRSTRHLPYVSLTGPGAIATTAEAPRPVILRGHTITNLDDSDLH